MREYKEGDIKKFFDELLEDAKEREEKRVSKLKKTFPEAKYEYGDWVKFKIQMFHDTPVNEFTGQIAIIDRYGTFEQNEEPSYDIYVEDMNCLFKHIRQSGVEFVKKGDGTCAIETPMNKSGEKK